VRGGKQKFHSLDFFDTRQADNDLSAYTKTYETDEIIFLKLFGKNFGGFHRQTFAEKNGLIRLDVFLNQQWQEKMNNLNLFY